MSDEYLIETFEHEGIECKIMIDPWADDPRGMRDEITRWIWGSQHKHLAEKHDEHIDLDLYDYRESKWTPTALAARWLTLCDDYAIVVPFRIEDYGSNGSRAYLTDINDDRVHGFVGISRRDLEKEREHNTDEWRFDPLAYIYAMFGEFQAWVAGEVFGWVVADGCDDEDSCWGYYGDIDYVRTQAKEAAAAVAHERYVNTEPPDMAEVLR